MAVHEHMPRRGILKGAVLAPVAACARPAPAFTDPDCLPGLLGHGRPGREAWPAASDPRGEESSEEKEKANRKVALHAGWPVEATVASSPRESAAQVKSMTEGSTPDLAKAPEPPALNRVPCARLGRLAAGQREIAQ